ERAANAMIRFLKMQENSAKQRHGCGQMQMPPAFARHRHAASKPYRRETATREFSGHRHSRRIESCSDSNDRAARGSAQTKTAARRPPSSSFVEAAASV